MGPSARESRQERHEARPGGGIVDLGLVCGRGVRCDACGSRMDWNGLSSWPESVVAAETAPIGKVVLSDR